MRLLQWAPHLDLPKPTFCPRRSWYLTVWSLEFKEGHMIRDGDLVSHSLCGSGRYCFPLQIHEALRSGRIPSRCRVSRALDQGPDGSTSPEYACYQVNVVIAWSQLRFHFAFLVWKILESDTANLSRPERPGSSNQLAIPKALVNKAYVSKTIKTPAFTFLN